MENICTTCPKNGTCTASTGLCHSEYAADFGSTEARLVEFRPTRQEGWVCDYCGTKNSKDSQDCPACAG